ncbi:MAG: hypothetical protein ACHQ51_07460 [Elusimicrobiota bacterium]
MIIRLHIRISAGLFRAGLVCLLLTGLAGDLCSEAVTLTTYYPAPSGAYTQLITTAGSFFSRDSGTLVIGSASTANAILKMAVMGNVGIKTVNPATFVGQVNPVRLDINGAGGAVVDFVVNEKIETGDGAAVGAVWFNSNSVASAKIGANGTSVFGIYNGNVPNWPLTVSGVAGQGNVGVNRNPSGFTLDVNGALASREAVCGPGNIVNYIAVAGNGVTPCPANTYATWASGVMTNYQHDSGPAVLITGSMLCCPCPTGSSCLSAFMP